MHRRHVLPWRDPPHPFLQRLIPSSDGTFVFHSPAAGLMRSLIAHHVVHGRVVFPGAGYLEMARAAATGKALAGVFFLQPLAAETPRLLVECALSHGRFEVRTSESEPRLRHRAEFTTIV